MKLVEVLKACETVQEVELRVKNHELMYTCKNTDIFNAQFWTQWQMFTYSDEVDVIKGEGKKL